MRGNFLHLRIKFSLYLKCSQLGFSFMFWKNGETEVYYLYLGMNDTIVKRVEFTKSTIDGFVLPRHYAIKGLAKRNQ